jgi:hypothetical protein
VREKKLTEENLLAILAARRKDREAAEVVEIDLGAD